MKFSNTSSDVTCSRALGDALVALLQDVARFGPGLVGEHQRERVVLDALAPQLVEFGGVLGPGRVLAVELEALVDREVRFLLERREREGHALAVALLEAVEDGEGGVELAGRDRVVELVAVLLELGDVAREEIAARAVERLEVAVEHQRGHRVVDRRLAVMRPLEHAADQPGHLGLPLGRREIRGRGAGGGRRRLCRAEQQRAHRQDQRGDDHRARATHAATGGGVLIRLFWLVHLALDLDCDGTT